MAIILNKIRNTPTGEKNLIFDAFLPEINNTGFIKEGSINLKLSKNNLGIQFELTPDECRMMRDVLTSFLKKHDNELMILFKQGRTLETKDFRNDSQNHRTQYNEPDFNKTVDVPMIKRNEFVEKKQIEEFDLPGMNLFDESSEEKKTNNEVEFY